MLSLAGSFVLDIFHRTPKKMQSDRKTQYNVCDKQELRVAQTPFGNKEYRAENRDFFSPEFYEDLRKNNSGDHPVRISTRASPKPQGPAKYTHTHNTCRRRVNTPILPAVVAAVEGARSGDGDANCCHRATNTQHPRAPSPLSLSSATV